MLLPSRVLLFRRIIGILTRSRLLVLLAPGLDELTSEFERVATPLNDFPTERQCDLLSLVRLAVLLSFARRFISLFLDRCLESLDLLNYLALRGLRVETLQVLLELGFVERRLAVRQSILLIRVLALRRLVVLLSRHFFVPPRCSDAIW